MTSGAEPVRTCVGCRVRTVKSALLRVVEVDGTLVPDPRGRSAGRGAHVHPTAECVSLAERHRAFARTLRFAGTLDASALLDYVSHHTEQSGIQP
ncbi:MAG TPA: YlxR family protein [Mycobacteriales bacterium]|nr:YlxR family protein [Mycobacteriales bacterium]